MAALVTSHLSLVRHSANEYGLVALRIFLSASALLFLGACSTGNHQGNSPKTAPLEGTWNCAFATVDGKPLPDATVKLLRLTLTKDHYKTEKGTEVLFDSSYTI